MRILIIRGIADELDLKNYNSQEIGLAKALVLKGNQCDIIYFSKNERDEKIIFKDKQINIYYRKGIKIFNNTIYYKEIFNKLLSKYDLIQSNEYNQLMTLITSILYKNKVIAYHGPYKKGQKIQRKLVDFIYDFLFKKILNKNLKLIFTKSILAQKYLEAKDLKNIYTIGVGLDTEKLSNTYLSESNTNKEKKILYIGQIIPRKNVIFLLKIMKQLVSKNYKLTIIGKGNKEYLRVCQNYIKENNLGSAITILESVPQGMLGKYYENNDIFLLPSKEEIFGMVLLEAMYFGMTVISSLNGGSSTVIENSKNGYLIDEIKEEKWIKKIEQYSLLNKKEKLRLKDEARNTIRNNFLWDCIADRYIDILNFKKG